MFPSAPLLLTLHNQLQLLPCFFSIPLFMFEWHVFTYHYLMVEYFRQTLAIFRKNFLVSWRTKEFLRELVTVVIFLALIVTIYRVEGSDALVIPFYMTLTLVSYSRAMVISWVSERQTRQKELQQIMGLNPYAHFTGWIGYYILNGLLVSVVFIFPLKWLGVYESYFVSFGQLLLLYLLYMLSSFFFLLFLSTFFNDAKVASQGASFIQLLTTLLYFLTFVKRYCSSSLLLKLSSVFPPLAYDFALMSSDIVTPVYQLNYSFNTGLIALGIDSLIFFLLFVYMEQVFPHEVGTAKHPLFFLSCFKSNKIHRESIELLDINIKCDHPSAKYYEDIEIKTAQTVQVFDVTKSFGELNAVDHVTFSLYEREIFCLLGHNGAGKSTIINLLTGLSQKSSGKIFIKGMDIDTSMDEVRKSLGLCLQQNVLYDDLTIEDHLKFYCRIKGVTQSMVERDVEETLVKCALGNQRGKLSKNLSGGNKRKLCLAIALVGGSKIIFLDQPSSGLDPDSRQSIWGILKEMRNQNRTVVLTTHHLEEAEALAQRIAIMTHGKLLILGSSDFIKHKFGVGYHLLITITEDQRQPVMTLMNQKLPGVRLDEQSANNVLKYILPLQRQNEFTELFKTLEPLNLNISLKMCTLEDTFVNIGMHGDDEEGNQDFPDLPQVEQPLDIRPIYSFSAQFQAVFNKKALSTLRSFSSVMSIALPVMFMLIGTLVTIIAFKDEPDNIDPQIWNYIKLSVLAYFMVWSFIFNTSSYCGGIVLEREKRFKYLSNVMGLRKFPYWMANFTFDLLLFLIPVAVFFIIVLAMGNSAQFLTSKLQYLVPVFVLFGLSFITYSYTWSFVFQKSNTAYRFFPFINFLFFYLLPMISVYASPQSVATKYVVPAVSPFLAFYFVFFTNEMGNYVQFIAPSYSYLLGVLFIQALVFALLTLFLESIRFSLKDRYEMNEDDLNGSMIENEDVKEEERRVVQLDHQEPIVIDKLYKKYNNGYVAIRNNTFVVQEGEMFGLLGPNGAGKSSTFNVMTAAIPKTAGSVKLSGVEVNKGMMDVFQDVGICPQSDSFYDNLSVTEHLSYFAQLKGQSSEAAAKLVNYYLKVMQLEEYAKIKAGKLSGGNKRKLCVSMAMIGNPRLMFFDEPSSAVDPIARRFLWRTLSESLRYSGSSIVLTTHSMSEAESLCSRIGILIKGKFVCMGTPADLKKKFGNGYSIVVKLPDWGKLEAVREKLKGLYPSYQEYPDQQSLKVTFQIPQNAFSFSKTFDLFENTLVKDGSVENFQTSEASLEQIFLFFSRMQPAESADIVRPEPWDICCFQWGNEGCFLSF